MRLAPGTLKSIRTGAPTKLGLPDAAALRPLAAGISRASEFVWGGIRECSGRAIAEVFRRKPKTLTETGRLCAINATAKKLVVEGMYQHNRNGRAGARIDIYKQPFPLRRAREAVEFR
jgi:hypothetical protein